MTLIERLEAATAIQQAELLRGAIILADGNKWIDRETAHQALAWIDCGAFLDAALSLVPDGFDYIVYRVDGECCAEVGPTGSFGFTKCVGPPTTVLALCIASLRARGMK